MKSITKNIFSSVLSLMLLMGLPAISSAQSGTTAPGPSAKTDVTITLLVPGVCGMCKDRIESTAMDVSGVKKAEWDQKTDSLVVVGSAKMDKQKVADALAKAGYRSDLAKADPKGYSKLPGCCKYDSGAKKE
ncbi:MAG: heavy metal-associated domain-containing protein [Saprospiraceae bacterium]